MPNRRGAVPLVETLVVIGIVVLLNVVGYLVAYRRVDITEAKQYTISPASKKILREMDDPVSVEFFMSKDLPPQMVSLRDQVRDKLEELEIYGGGKFRVKYTDPGDDTEAQTRAEGLGVPKFSLQVVEREQASRKDVFFGMVMNYRDKSEAIPQVLDPAGLEYEVVSRLKRMTLKEKPKIGVFVGPINLNQQQAPEFSGIRQLLSGQEGFYELVDLDPAKDKTLPEGLAGVMVFGAFGLSEELKYAIDQFLLAGGDVFIGLDPIMETGGAQGMGSPDSAFPSLPTIEDQLEKYGLKINKKLIADTGSPGNAQMQLGPGFVIQQPYPLWPKIGPTGIADDVGALSGLDAVVPMWCAPVNDVATPGVKHTPLFFTSADSFLLNSPFKLDPMQNWEFLATSSEEKGPFKVAYLVSGEIPSAFDKPPAPAGGGASSFDESKHLAKAKGDGRLIFISSAKMFSDNFLRQSQENQLLVLTLGDTLALGEDLAGIRNTPVTNRPLRVLNDSQKSAIRWVMVTSVPLLVIALGLALWLTKNRRRQAIARRYAS
jgi:ABC-2 type transport system permease protein